MGPSFRPAIAAAFALALVVLALNAIISARNLRRVAENNRRTLGTEEAIRDLERPSRP